MAQPSTPTAERIRRFNRFYTQKIGSLDDRHEGLDVTLAQSRLLISVRDTPGIEVGDLSSKLELEQTFASRTLGVLEDRGLLERSISNRDRRARTVTLTKTGTDLINDVEQRSNTRVSKLIDHLQDDGVDSLLEAMNTIERLLGHDEEN